MAFKNAGKIACLLIENSFTSIPDMAKQILPWKGLQYLPIWFHKNKVHLLRIDFKSTVRITILYRLNVQFQSKIKIAAIQCPVLFISGLADQLVPPSMMMDLYSHCSSERKLLLQIPNGDHNGTWTRPTYYSQLKRCVEDLSSDRAILQQSHSHVHTV